MVPIPDPKLGPRKVFVDKPVMDLECDLLEHIGPTGPGNDDIRSKIEAAQSAALPSSALSKACQYALALWKKLTRFLEYPE